MYDGNMETTNQPSKERKVYTVTPEPLSGMRQAAVKLTAGLPADLSDADVIIDATNRKSYAQGFVDELCSQIAQVRSAATLTIISEDEMLIKRAETSAHLRDFSDRLFFRS